LAAILIENQATDEAVRRVEGNGRDRFEFGAVFDFTLVEGFEIINDHIPHSHRQHHRLLGQLSQGELVVCSRRHSIEEPLLVVHNASGEEMRQLVTASWGEIVVDIVTLEKSLQTTPLLHPRTEGQELSFRLIECSSIERFDLSLPFAIRNGPRRGSVGIERTSGPSGTRR
jgi:hypothetical protein